MRSIEGCSTECYGDNIQDKMKVRLRQRICHYNIMSWFYVVVWLKETLISYTINFSIRSLDIKYNHERFVNHHVTLVTAVL